jgi:predicted ferric reductase
MATDSRQSTDITSNLPQIISAQDVLLLILVIFAGVLLAVNLLPLWIPAMSQSAIGDQPKVFWYLSRGSAIAGYWMLWLAMAMGIIITNKMAQVWPGIPPAYEIHQYTSLFGMGIGLFHALILMGDQYINYSVFQVLVPFSSINYRPVWVGIGQIAFYVWLIVNMSFYIRKRIGKRTWRIIHFASYASFIATTIHAVFSGTDSTTAWAPTCIGLVLPAYCS